MSPRKIVFAAGGTAGHIEPALAVAKEWRRRFPSDDCIFMGTPEGLENTLVPESGFALENVSKVPMPRRLDLNLLQFPLRMWNSVRQAEAIVHRASLVVGFGGYVSASAYVAAKKLRIPLVIHDANAKIGWANRLGSYFTENLAVSRGVQTSRFSRATVTGTPLRQDVHEALTLASSDWRSARAAAKKSMGWELSVPSILILGGSQGSLWLNNEIASVLPELQAMNVSILHAVGNKNVVPLNSGNYRATPYITDMATAYLAADLVISRSGAITCSELEALGRFSLFIPLPIGNGEQALNAQNLVQAERAVIVAQKTFSGSWLISHLPALVIQALNTPLSGLVDDRDAARKIANMMESVMKREGM